MKSFLEALRGARYLEWFLLVVLLSALGLMLINAAGSNGPSDRLPEETRLKRLLEGIDGVGKVDVMITTDDAGRPSGAVVVAGGLDDIGPRLEIQSAVQALLGLDLDHIRVIGRGGMSG